jgi:hypothetical protein
MIMYIVLGYVIISIKPCFEKQFTIMFLRRCYVFPFEIKACC